MSSSLGGIAYISKAAAREGIVGRAYPWSQFAQSGAMPSQPHSVTAQNSKFGLLTRPLGPVLQNNEHCDSRLDTSHSSEFSQRRETLSATYYRWRLLSNWKKLRHALYNIAYWWITQMQWHFLYPEWTGKRWLSFFPNLCLLRNFMPSSTLASRSRSHYGAHIVLRHGTTSKFEWNSYKRPQHSLSWNQSPGLLSALVRSCVLAGTRNSNMT